MLLPLLLLGCVPDDPKETGAADDTFLWRDTAPVIETAETDEETGDSAVDTAETGDTAADTGDTADTGSVDTWLSLRVWPEAIAVHPGATFALRVVGEDPDGVSGDLPGDLGAPVYTVDDAAIASVDAAGTVTAVAAGATTVRVAMGGLEATCAIEVRADGVATITVLDGRSGAPIENARVALPFTDAVRTDATGVALLPVADGGPLTFSAWVDDTWNAVTVTGVVGRALTVSILPKDTDLRSATLTGAVDFSGVDDAGWSDVVVGFASGSLQGALGSTRLEDLFAAERGISVFGVDAEAPANLFVEDAAETYEAIALPGAVAVWGLAGPIAIADATAGLSGTGDALALLADNLDAMSWGHVPGLLAAADTATAADLAPAERFEDHTPVSLPPLSAGFSGDEPYFLLVAEERADEGFLVTGLGTGSPASSADVPTLLPGTVADSLGTSVLAYAQVGGVGSGGPVATAVGTVGPEGTVIVPMLQDIATVTTWDPATRGFGFAVDDDAHFVRVRFTDSRNRVHDLFAPGSWTGTVPNCVTSFGLASASIEILSLRTSNGAYESWLSAGELDPDVKSTVTAARTTQE